MLERLEAWSATNGRVRVVLASLVLLAFANVVNGPLFFDDLVFIGSNEHVTRFDLAEIYTSSVSEGAGFPSNTYRPNQQLVFAVLHRLFGSWPVPYHLVSIGVHVANAWLVFGLLLALGFGRVASFVASLLFAVHPIQTQSVSYVAGLAGPLAALFLLAGLRVWLASLESPTRAERTRRFALALLFFALAFTSKSNMVILAPTSLLLGVFWLLVRRPTDRRYLAASLACFWLLSLAYLALKLTLLNFAGTFGMVEGSNFYTEHLWVRVLTFVSVLPSYLSLIFWPVGLTYTKPWVHATTLFDPRGLLGLAIVGIGVAALLRARRWPSLFLGVGWFFAALAPYSGVIPLPSIYLEHWLYVPSIGLAMLLAAGWRASGERARRGMAALLLPLLIACVLLTSARNREWSDPERFYQSELARAGPSIRMLNNLATVYRSRGETDRAIEILELVIQGWDELPEPHHNLASIYVERGQLERARLEFERALALDPDLLASLEGLRDVCERTGRMGEALALDTRIRELRRRGGG